MKTLAVCIPYSILWPHQNGNLYDMLFQDKIMLRVGLLFFEQI